MKNWKKRIGIFLLCGMCLAPQMIVQADNNSSYSDEADDDEIADAVNRL